MYDDYPRTRTASQERRAVRRRRSLGVTTIALLIPVGVVFALSHPVATATLVAGSVGVVIGRHLHRN